MKAGERVWASEFFSVRRGPHVVNRMENRMMDNESITQDAGITPIRMCFAYNLRAERCDMPGGHPGDHSITMTWNDDECYAPGAPLAMGIADGHFPSHGETQIVEHLVDVPEELEDCAVCDHSAEYHPMQGPCIMSQCDCKNYVG